ncbi:MAG: epimerase [Candidatus Magasanikbacteria bacterium CG10_big_fil_rev_8_21_14_0_10_36_32]|uniref:Epimerase n=1 Tax=Candidatus Magasanikbacteria bacterium CG10_big_fil_rev_8_21_14_0_10_36_32 TaxID=1974646 RepID=A0A2M6W5S9_9BACT|nr:MAG: epimerase [Candidatus Magasanikbacteria bacterium CG10_big_fil_rev_8_21_14_0_10_36_32]
MREVTEFNSHALIDDLNYILIQTKDFWEDLRGKRLFITGGTGFFGSWLLESFAWANEKLNLNASVLVLTRNADDFKKRMPHLADNPAIKFHIGDIRHFDFPEGEFSHIIHAAATSAVATFNKEDPLVKFETIVEGTRRVLDFAVHCHAKKVLLTSSGAVYGKQPSEMTQVSEDYLGAPDSTDINSAWGVSKRSAEFIGVYYAKKYNIEIKIVRCFSFVGPYLPLDIHYAVGNFIRDALTGGPIMINGDGTPHRSYLYAADLMIWLWIILIKGESCRIYNVGSSDDITIADLAEAVADNFPGKIEVKIARPLVSKSPPERYVPSTVRAEKELGLKQIISLKDAIKRTIIYHQKINK